jgi:hypothetical protein
VSHRSLVIPRHPHVQEIDVAVRLGVTTRDRTEDRQFGDAVLPAELGQASAKRLDLVQETSTVTTDGSGTQTDQPRDRHQPLTRAKDEQHPGGPCTKTLATTGNRTPART